jgi:hypothetical protein
MRMNSELVQPLAIRCGAFLLTLTLSVIVHSSFRSVSSSSIADATLRVGDTDSAAILHVCEVHGQRIEAQYVSILAGAPGYPLKEVQYRKAKERFFPNSRFFIVDRSRSVTDGHALVYICSKCRAAEREWLLSHSYAGIRLDVPRF